MFSQYQCNWLTQKDLIRRLRFKEQNNSRVQNAQNVQTTEIQYLQLVFQRGKTIIAGEFPLPIRQKIKTGAQLASKVPSIILALQTEVDYPNTTALKEQKQEGSTEGPKRAETNVAAT